MDKRRIAGALYGALVGDAMGVPYEFKSSANIPAIVNGLPPADYPRSHPDVPFGCWSDDGSQLLCLLDTLSDSAGEFSESLFSWQLVKWFTEARHQSGGRVFDCGLGTASVLRRLAEGVSPSSVRAIGSEGNGSLMRALAVVLATLRYAQGAPDNLLHAVDLAIKQSAVTHAGAVPKAACAAYAALAMRLYENPGLPVRDTAFEAIADLRLSPPVPALADALASLGRFGKQELPTGGGHATNAFWSAVTAVDGAGSYREAIQRAIAFGNDTDTTACIAGGLAGLMWGEGGEKGVPAEWIGWLVVPPESRRLIETFLTACAA